MAKPENPLSDLLVCIDRDELDALEAAKTRWAVEEDGIRAEFESRRQFARDGYSTPRQTTDREDGK